jgi:molybdopterin biosynthesis enzyme
VVVVVVLGRDDFLVVVVPGVPWAVVVVCEVVVAGLVAPAHADQEVVATEVPSKATATITPPTSRDVCGARRR